MAVARGAVALFLQCPLANTLISVVVVVRFWLVSALTAGLLTNRPRLFLAGSRSMCMTWLCELGAVRRVVLDYLWEAFNVVLRKLASVDSFEGVSGWRSGRTLDWPSCVQWTPLLGPGVGGCLGLNVLRPTVNAGWAGRVVLKRRSGKPS